jgi:hypothetical protein
MREVWVADSETEGFRHRRVPRPFIWGVYNGVEYHEFDTTEKFLDFITAKECIVYAHNGGKFDWFFILSHLEPFEPIQVINGRLAKFKIGMAEFRDSYNILPMPLSAYKKDEIDYGIFDAEQRAKPENMVKIRNYLRSDCVYLFELVSQFLKTYGANLTQASAAMKVWQKISGIKSPKTSSGFYDYFAPYYYGGRVECFKKGVIETPFSVIDINSAYPFAMMQSHPFGDNYDISDSLPNSRAYVQRSFITVRGISAGALPYRADDNSLFFPIDNCMRTYRVTGWEFLAAIETKTLTDWEILEVITFSDSIKFDNYVNHFYEIKSHAEKGSPEYIFSKLFLNSLYGKFGANPEKYEEYMVVRPQYIEAANVDGYDFCAELDKWALVSRPLAEEKQRYYNIAVAASVTGFVRAYLWRAIKQCKGVIYCDTDSISCADYSGLATSKTALGAWDVEATCNRGAVAGKKLYAFHTNAGTWKTASKGVKLTPAEIFRIAQGETVEYKPEAPTFSLKRDIKIFGPESESELNLDKMFQTRKVTML